MGFFKLWSMKDFTHDSAIHQNFKELIFIKAHPNEIACLDFLTHNAEIFIITGSLDKNMHLYTTRGTV